MSRNSEKQLSGLNRFLRAQEEESLKDKIQKRPPLKTLNTASEIKNWIPSIKRDISYCLHHLSGVRNYPEKKISEFQERLELLEREYERFVKKVKVLDPSTIGTPGEAHKYYSKRKFNSIAKETSEAGSLDFDTDKGPTIRLRVLEQDENKILEPTVSVTTLCEEHQNQPLEFRKKIKLNDILTHKDSPSVSISFTFVIV
ncbi:hypothetical protein K7432_005045 [Basidiobolus ranarum]|uniref:Uncharacterized protein n=1 Tax=Basidiobolus ranarum TaxID=34480 RepID=A0ABR2WX66_9FUNG